MFSYSASHTGLVESMLGDSWDRINSHFVRAPAVATALRRLAAKGVAEKRGDKIEGVEFRKRAEKT